MEIFGLEYQQLLEHFWKLGLAFIFTIPVGYERERATRIMGLRTFPLVGIASCGFVLMASVELGESPEAQARIIQGLMAGIGFIGGGAILKQEDGVRGTATAASIWGTGVIGGSVAYGRLEIAILVSLVTLILLRAFTPIKDRIDGE